MSRRTANSQFQSTLPAKGATLSRSSWHTHPTSFNPRSPRRERRPHAHIGGQFTEVSIHAPREGSDFASAILMMRMWRFQSTLPAKGATFYLSSFFPLELVSIHAPREGSDGKALDYLRPLKSFNPRSPRRERPNYITATIVCQMFQSTLPAKGATGGGCPNQLELLVSIHAPREGSDTETWQPGPNAMGFNPRSPRRERRAVHVVCVSRLPVSIHAPREGSDDTLPIRSRRKASFNPRSPRRERPGVAMTATAAELFQSTLPAKGATSSLDGLFLHRLVSIHAPREGSDVAPLAYRCARACFNPRSPRRERPYDRPALPHTACFNPRSPRRERPQHLVRRVKFPPDIGHVYYQ